MVFLCSCGRSFITEEWLTTHVDRAHGGAAPEPGPTATERIDPRPGVPQAEGTTAAGTSVRTPRRSAGLVRRPARTRSYLHVAPMGRAWHASRPIAVSNVCPGRATPREEQGWPTVYNLGCGVEISPTRDRCSFHRRPE